MTLEEARNNMGKRIYYYYVDNNIYVKNFEFVNSIKILKDKRIFMYSDSHSIDINNCYLNKKDAIDKFKRLTGEK